MHFEFLVEEESAEAALNILVPKIVGAGITFKIHTFQGKPDLLKNLPARLKGYRLWLPDDWRIIVLIDKDQRECMELKMELERVAREARLVTRSAAQGDDRFQVLNRLAIEELEAWFFGDVEAIATAYPRIPANLDKKVKYRDPDRITGGTWEALERVLQRAGYYRDGLRKPEAARQIAMYMEPGRNRSKSFQVFRDALRAMAP